MFEATKGCREEREMIRNMNSWRKMKLRKLKLNQLLLWRTLVKKRQTEMSCKGAHVLFQMIPSKNLQFHILLSSFLQPAKISMVRFRSNILKFFSILTMEAGKLIPYGRLRPWQFQELLLQWSMLWISPLPRKVNTGSKDFSNYSIPGIAWRILYAPHVYWWTRNANY